MIAVFCQLFWQANHVKGVSEPYRARMISGFFDGVPEAFSSAHADYMLFSCKTL